MYQIVGKLLTYMHLYLHSKTIFKGYLGLGPFQKRHVPKTSIPPNICLVSDRLSLPVKQLWYKHHRGMTTRTAKKDVCTMALYPLLLSLSPAPFRNVSQERLPIRGHDYLPYYHTLAGACRHVDNPRVYTIDFRTSG